MAADNNAKGIADGDSDHEQFSAMNGAGTESAQGRVLSDEFSFC